VKLTNMQIDIQLIRKFNGDDLLSKVFYHDGYVGSKIEEVLPCKKTGGEFRNRHLAEPDDSRVYYITQEIGYPEVTLVGDRDDD